MTSPAAPEHPGRPKRLLSNRNLARQAGLFVTETLSYPAPTHIAISSGCLIVVAVRP